MRRRSPTADDGRFGVLLTSAERLLRFFFRLASAPPPIYYFTFYQIYIWELSTFDVNSGESGRSSRSPLMSSHSSENLSHLYNCIWCLVDDFIQSSMSSPSGQATIISCFSFLKLSAYCRLKDVRKSRY